MLPRNCSEGKSTTGRTGSKDWLVEQDFTETSLLEGTNVAVKRRQSGRLKRPGKTLAIQVPLIGQLVLSALKSLMTTTQIAEDGLAVLSVENGSTTSAQACRRDGLGIGLSILLIIG